MKKEVLFDELDGSGLRVAIIQARWNRDVTDALTQACIDTLEAHGVAHDDIHHQFVPGAFELPFAAGQIQKVRRVDVIIPIGSLVKGETMHFEYIADAVAHGIMDLNTQGDIPVLFGILTCLSEEQAVARATGEENHGIGWAKSAIEIARFSGE